MFITCGYFVLKTPGKRDKEVEAKKRETERKEMETRSKTEERYSYYSANIFERKNEVLNKDEDNKILNQKKRTEEDELRKARTFESRKAYNIHMEKLTKLIGYETDEVYEIKKLLLETPFFLEESFLTFQDIINHIKSTTNIDIELDETVDLEKVSKSSVTFMLDEPMPTMDVLILMIRGERLTYRFVGNTILLSERIVKK